MVEEAMEMSKLANAIRAVDLNRMRPVQSSLYKITLESNAADSGPLSYHHDREYAIKAEFGGRCWVSADGSGKGEIGAAISSMKKMLIEEVFGEFRGPLIKALHAIKYGDQNEAEQYIKTVLESMFG